MKILLNDFTNKAICGKLQNSIGSTIIKAIFGGVFISLGGASSLIASIGLSLGVARLVSAIIFPIGLILIILSGSELFTGDILLVNTLIRDRKYMSKILCFLALVLGWNLIGCALTSYILVAAGFFNSFNGQVGAAVLKIAINKLQMPLFSVFVSSIMCNFCVCLATLLSGLTHSPFKKLPFIFIPIFIFVICGFEHIIADAFYLSAAKLLVNYPEIVAATGYTKDFIFGLLASIKNINFILITTLGNIIGGIILTVCSNLFNTQISN